jgi:hypothetical protein
LSTTQACLGPFRNNGEQHLLYIEAEDNTGLRSLGIIRFTVVRATFENDLLFVDDARLAGDQFFGNPPQMDPPRGEWPTASELDTFFFARGGFTMPEPHYPPGTISTPGIFHGYAFDTIGTRGRTRGILPLAVLGKYKHVVWYTDANGSSYPNSPTDPFSPITAIRLMSSPGQPSTISTYLKQGGTLWMFGGGAAYGSLVPWNLRGSPSSVYLEEAGELVPGRFMYDFPHWRNGVEVLPATQANRLVPNFQFPFVNPTTAPGRGWIGQPSYDLLPRRLQPKDYATDPLPPLREQNPGLFYLTTYTAEYTHLPNFIREDADTIPGGAEESQLDTLYLTAGGSAQPTKPVMTYYHGFENPAAGAADRRSRVVFSGFPLWYFQRDQIIPVADWVLQQVFGLSHDGSSRAPNAAAARAAAVRTAAARAAMARRAGAR